MCARTPPFGSNFAFRVWAIPVFMNGARQSDDGVRRLNIYRG